MKTRHQLSPRERDFFALANQAVFANPFSDERAQIDKKIAQSESVTDSDSIVQQSQAVIRRRIQRLSRQQKADIRLYGGKDRTLVRNVFLYDFFNCFIDRFDHLIIEQIEAGDTPLKVSFAREAFSHLEQKGYTLHDSIRYFEILYQLRRAYYFIDRSLVGRSAAMKELRRQLWNNVFTTDIGFYNDHLWDRMEDFSTLILGETGTGKGTAAAAIGRSGFIPYSEERQQFAESFTHAFIALNLSQYPENLIESELFGHKKGAFTGAVDDYEGIFDRCSPHGAILLDEIGEVTIPIQIKLLQVLQERIFNPVGSHARHRFHGRVIAATNRPLEEMRDRGLLRDDFFYRLCSDIIRVPPLRQRLAEDKSELDDLLEHTVNRLLGKSSPRIVGMVRRSIHNQLGDDYTWPGNVRELEQCLRRVLLNRSYTGEQPAHSGDLLSELSDALKTGRADAQQLLSGYCRLLYQRHGSFEAVSRRVKLDRRTVKKYIQAPVEPI